MKKLIVALALGYMLAGQVALADEETKKESESVTQQEESKPKADNKQVVDKKTGQADAKATAQPAGKKENKRLEAGDLVPAVSVSLPSFNVFDYGEIGVGFFNMDLRIGLTYMIHENIAVRGAVGLGFGAGFTGVIDAGWHGYVPLEAEIGWVTSFFKTGRGNPAVALGVGFDWSSAYTKAEVYARVRVPFTETLSIKAGYGFYGGLDSIVGTLEPTSMYSVGLVVGF